MIYAIVIYKVLIFLTLFIIVVFKAEDEVSIGSSVNAIDIVVLVDDVDGVVILLSFLLV